MGATLSVSVRVVSRVPKVKAQYRRAAERATALTAHGIQGEAQSRARVDTGAMRAGIVVQQIDPLNYRVVGLAEHTIYNEFGTSRMSAQPMFFPAAEMWRPRYLDMMRRLV